MSTSNSDTGRDRPLFIPVILGTPRQGRASEQAAKFLVSEVAKRGSVETELIDVREIPLRTDDAGEAIKDAKFSAVSIVSGRRLSIPPYGLSVPMGRFGYFIIVIL